MIEENRIKIIEKLFRVMASLRTAVGFRAAKYLNEHKLSFAQMHTLYYLDARKNSTIKQLAAEMNITSSAATQIVEGLVRHNYLSRGVVPHDRRSVIIQFSEAGREKFEQFRKGHIRQVAELLAAVSDEEIKILLQIFKKINLLHK